RKQGDLAQMARMNEIESDVVFRKPIAPCGFSTQVMVPAGLDTRMMWVVLDGHVCPGKTKTVLVFRDSFATALSTYFNQDFGNVIYVWDRPDDETFVRMVQLEHPDIVIEERVERTMQWVPENQLQAALAKVSDPTTRGFTTAEW